MATDVGSRGTRQVHGSALLAQLCSHKVSVHDNNTA